MSVDFLRAQTIAILLVVLIGGPVAQAADPPTKELLDELLKEYKLYELPMPPKDAPLVRFPTGWRTLGKDGERDLYGLGFELKPDGPKDHPKCFWGTGSIRTLNRREAAERVEPNPDALKNVDSYVDVVLAVQCHTRGWDELAIAILKKSQVDEQRKRSIESALAKVAWSYWSLEFRRPETDRGEVARLLKLIMKRHGEALGEAEKAYLRSLELSLQPDRGKPGTIEAMIDDLMDATSTDRTAALMRVREPHPAYLELARRGFEAVPFLIEHINDDRLTRAYKEGFNNFRGYNYRVGDMVCDLLQGIAGDDVGKSWLRRLQGYRLEKEEIEKWWATVKKVGEEKYFVGHVFDGSEKGNLENWLMLDILAHKYPKQLPGVYRKVLEERPTAYGWEIASAVAGSSLSRESKRELFVDGAKSKSLSFRLDAIGHLRALDSANALELLVLEINTVPTVPEEEFWNCTECRIGYLVRQANEPTAWAALETTAKRVDVGLRMEYLQNVTRRDVPSATRKALLAFLAKFLDDTEVRNAEGPKYKGLYAGKSGPSRIEVRNFAAQQIAWVFDMDVEPDKSWTDAQWSKFRDDVRKALAREGIR